jgi:hypothetical protein
MSPGRLNPWSRTVALTVLGRRVDLPENSTLLRGFEQLWPKAVSYGKFCWNHECGNSKVWFRLRGETHERRARACRLVAVEGMEITQVSAELRHTLRELLARPPDEPPGEERSPAEDTDPFPEPAFRDAR